MSNQCGIPDCLLIGDHEHVTGSYASSTAPTICSCCQGDVTCRRHADLESELAQARQQVTTAQNNNHARNLELDALHYVWCDGGCEGGVHRFGEHPPLTAEMVAIAEHQARRLRRWYIDHEGRALPPVSESRISAWTQAERDIHTAYVKQAEQENERLRERLKLALDALDKIAATPDSCSSPDAHCLAMMADDLLAAIKEPK